MPKFSQRYGYTKIERAFQRESIDETLRVAIWNLLSNVIWNLWEPYRYTYTDNSIRINSIAERVWLHHFKKDLDQLPVFRNDYGQGGAYSILKQHFLTCPWYVAYDFLEFLLQDHDGSLYLNKGVVHILNNILETENAAYRIVGSEIVEITDSNEIKAIEEALSHPDTPVRTHIESSLAMLSDRVSPDYRNSIKESISAVEAVCRIITGLNGATLGDALKKVPNLHLAMQKSFLALYGFTSDASGIRHSLLEESTLTYTDAKFMLSSCSAFVSYLRSSATPANPV